MRHNASTDQYKHSYMATQTEVGGGGRLVVEITLSLWGCITLAVNSLDLDVGQYTHADAHIHNIERPVVPDEQGWGGGVQATLRAE